MESFNFRDELPDDMFDILLQALQSGSVITCSMEVRVRVGVLGSYCYTVLLTYGDLDDSEFTLRPWSHVK